MTDIRNTKVSRRDLLKKSLLLPIAAVVPAIIATRNADASSKAPKAVMMYQDKPLGKHMCSNCIHFEPAHGSKEKGSCAVVAGVISPHGWCVAYTSKSTK